MDWCRTHRKGYEEALIERSKKAHHKRRIKDYDRYIGFVRVYVPGWRPEEATGEGGFD